MAAFSSGALLDLLTEASNERVKLLFGDKYSEEDIINIQAISLMEICERLREMLKPEYVIELNEEIAAIADMRDGLSAEREFERIIPFYKGEDKS